ncbi:MAG TPA: FAD-dependent oxidoreductase, partial [Rhizobiaceae bacterium]|nr:FAD-dependent oxidoreductase [Rhizobiaceae bacterium]
MSAPSANTGQNRIPGKGRLSPARTVSFTWDGKRLGAMEGDTLASALIANGIHLAGRSFKYHRPRGILSGGAEEPNALATIARDAVRMQPNIRAPMQEVFDGMIATSQNRWPSLAFDIGAVNDWMGRFLSAGFYYKTFMWPKSFWKDVYEPFIRQAAGLGSAPKEADPDRYANRFAHCDVLVVGAGPAGLSAALGAARSGKRVIICDENAQAGGHLRADATARISGKPGYEWAQSVVAELSANANVTVLPRTTAFGYYSHNMVALVEQVTDHIARPAADQPRERLWQVRAGKVVLATGAIERHIVFADNDRPGIMLASAAQLMLNHYGVSPGRKIGIYTACDSAWHAAFDFRQAGVDIAAIVDCRKDVPSALLAKANDLGIPVKTGHAVVKTSGRLRVKSMTVEPVDGTASTKFEIDSLLMSGGWTPSVHLFSQSRGKLDWDEAGGRFLPGIGAEDCTSVGACNGSLTLADAIREGALATGGPGPEVEEEATMSGFLLGAAKGAGPDDFVKAFVDYQNDVTAKDIRLAVKEGFRSIEHVKRYTTTGMATDQGKMSNLHGLAIAAHALGNDIPSVGHTTFRSPYTPVTFGTIVNHAKGDLFDPTRRTPMHGWAQKHGAMFEDVGQWKRAWYFPRGGEAMKEAVDRECLAVRNVAGIFDAST